MSEIPVDIIANIGVSTFVAVYLVFYITRSLNGKLEDLSKKIDRLIETMTKLNDRLDLMVHYNEKH